MTERPMPTEQGILAFHKRCEDFYPADAVDADISQQRAWYDALCAAFDAPPPEGMVKEDGLVAGRIPVRRYRPADVATQTQLFYIHGGGFVVGSLNSHDAICAELSQAAGAELVSVDYRLSPEHVWPAAFEDCWAVLAALLRENRPVVVMGDSAGGNLAAVVAQVTMDDSVPPPMVQTLIYPAVEASLSKPSHDLFADGFGLTRADMEWYRGMYLPDRSTWDLPTVSPLLAASLDGVAPAIVATAGFDPLRDEGDAYAERLANADVAVRWRCYDDMIHGFFGMGVIPECLAMATEIASATGDQLRAA